jgi:hypothetical protein
VDLEVIPDGMFLFMCVLCWDVLGMCPRVTQVMGIPTNNDEPKGNGALDIHLDLPIMAYL